MPEPSAGESVEPLLSIVIPTLGRPTLDEQLEALQRCTWDQPWEIVLADNGSEGRVAATCDRWRDRFPSLRYVDAADRRGRSHAVNCGAREARGRWLLFVDDDDLVEPDLVQAVGEAFQEGARVVVFNFDIRKVNSPDVWRSHVIAQAAEHGRPMFRQVPAVWGCSAVERRLFLELDGFDEDVPYAEDLDFSVRLHLQTDVVPVWLDRQLVHYRLQSDARSRFRQRVQVAQTIETVARRYPEVTAPAAASLGVRLRRLARDGVSTVPLLVRSPTRMGRLRLADRCGEAWGRFVAAGGRP